MRKLFLRILTFLAIVAACLGIVSCKEDTPGQSSGGNETVSLNKTSLSLVLGNSELLVAEYTGGLEYVLQWSSEDPSVVSVDENGQLTANDVGTTVINATYGSAVAKCAVTVALGNYMPTLDINTLGQTQLTVAKTETIDLSGKILFNGKTYDATFTYEVENETVGKMEDGTFVPVGLGTTKVTVTADWKGSEAATLTKTYEITVENCVVFIVNEGKTNRVHLYTAESHYGETFDTQMSFVATVERNGEDLGTIAPVIADESIVKYEDGTLKALKYGETTITLSYQDGETTFMKSVPVVVDRPVAEYDEPFTLFSAMDGDGKGKITFESVFGAGYKLTDASQDGKALTISADGKKVVGVQTSSSEMTETQLTVYTKECGFIFNAEAYTKVISNADDLAVFDITMEEVRTAFTKDDGKTGTVSMGANADNTLYVEGFYYVANDIDASGTAIAQTGLTGTETIDGVTYKYNKNGDTIDVVNESKYIGFRGVFDGGGHVISGLSLGRGGLFGNLVAGIDQSTTVRNIAFLGVTLDAQGATRGGNVLATHIQSNAKMPTVIENVYIQLADNQYTRGVLAYDYRAQGTAFKMNNVVIDCLTLTSNTAGTYGSLFGDVMGIDADQGYTLGKFNDGQIKNVYVLSGVTLTKVSTDFALYGVNEQAPTDLGVAKTLQLTGVSRYTTADAWADAKGNDYSSFTESGYWTLDENGLPVFGKKN